VRGWRQNISKRYRFPRSGNRQIRGPGDNYPSHGRCSPLAGLTLHRSIERRCSGARCYRNYVPGN